MTAHRTFTLHLLSLTAAGLTAIVASVSGCQPKEPVERTCSCICYKDTGKEVLVLEQTVTTTKECGNVNGSSCSGTLSGKAFDGQYANCGPNPNVANAFANAIKAAIASKNSGGGGSGSGGGHSGGMGTSGTSGSGQKAP
jgi:hypothetical protein